MMDDDDDDDDDIYESRKKDFVKFLPFLSFFWGKKSTVPRGHVMFNTW